MYSEAIEIWIVFVILIIYVIIRLLIATHEKELMKAKERQSRIGKSLHRDESEDPYVVIPDNVKDKSQKVSTQKYDARMYNTEKERYLRYGDVYYKNIDKKKKENFESDFYAESDSFGDDNEE